MINQEGVALRTQITVSDLTEDQFERIDQRLLTSYEIPAAGPRLCVVFELVAGIERHAEMPAQEFALLMTELAMVGAMPATAEALLTPDVLDDQTVPMPDVHIGIAAITPASQQ